LRSSSKSDLSLPMILRPAVGVPVLPHLGRREWPSDVVSDPRPHGDGGGDPAKHDDKDPSESVHSPTSVEHESPAVALSRASDGWGRRCGGVFIRLTCERASV
jgi:hypothetical protein